MNKSRESVFNKIPRGFSLPPRSYICYCEKEKLIFILLLFSDAWSFLKKSFQFVMKIFRYLKSAKNRTMNSHIPSHGFNNYQDPVTFALYISLSVFLCCRPNVISPLYFSIYSSTKLDLLQCYFHTWQNQPVLLLANTQSRTFLWLSKRHQNTVQNIHEIYTWSLLGSLIF